MAIQVKRSGDVKPVLAGRVQLPTEYIDPVGSLDDFNLFIHGEKKIGKTTLGLQADGLVLVIQFDPPRKAYKRIEMNPKSWEQFSGILKALEDAAKGGKFPYCRVVVDGVDQWFRMCQAWVCKKLVIDHPSEEGWGKGWDLLRKTFTDAVDRLMALPCGSWFLAHSAWKEVEDHTEKKVVKLLPVLTGQAEEILNGKCEGWFAYDYKGGERVLFIRGTERIGAGHCMDEDDFRHFRTPAGNVVTEIPMGRSPKEAYANLLRAFNNEQPFVNLAARNAAPRKGVVLGKHK